MLNLIVKSQLNLKEYYRINLYVLYRKRSFQFLHVISLLYVIGIILFFDQINWNSASAYIGVFIIAYTALMPLLMYFYSKKNFEKSPSDGELKTYSFNDGQIEFSGESLSVNMGWQHIDKIAERQSNYLMLLSNNKGFHYIPKVGFKSTEDQQLFRTLIKEKKPGTKLKK